MKNKELKIYGLRGLFDDPETMATWLLLHVL
jgi:hypothetical protein